MKAGFSKKVNSNYFHNVAIVQENNSNQILFSYGYSRFVLNIKKKDGKTYYDIAIISKFDNVPIELENMLYAELRYYMPFYVLCHLYKIIENENSEIFNDLKQNLKKCKKNNNELIIKELNNPKYKNFKIAQNKIGTFGYITFTFENNICTIFIDNSMNIYQYAFVINSGGKEMKFGPFKFEEIYKYLTQDILCNILFTISHEEFSILSDFKARLSSCVKKNNTSRNNTPRNNTSRNNTSRNNTSRNNTSRNNTPRNNTEGSKSGNNTSRNNNRKGNSGFESDYNRIMRRFNYPKTRAELEKSYRVETLKYHPNKVGQRLSVDISGVERNRIMSKAKNDFVKLSDDYEKLMKYLK